RSRIIITLEQLHNLRIRHGIVNPANSVVSVRPEAHISHSIIHEPFGNQVLVWWYEDEIRITGCGTCARFNIRSDDYAIAIAVESRPEFRIPFPLGIERKVKDDHSGPSIAKLVDELRVDSA